MPPSDLSGTLEGAGGIGGLLSRGAHAISSPYQLSSAAHYHADGNGNVTMLVGTGAPTIKAYYKYDPFGRTLGSSGSLVGANTMRFSSKPVMGSSELYYYGYRFYDPSSQRWLNRDPLGEVDGANEYQWLENDSIGKVDPDGRKIVIDPQASESFRRRMEQCLCVLYTSSHGKSLVDRASAHPETVTIKAEHSPPSTQGELGDKRVPVEITLSPKTRNGIPRRTQRKMKGFMEHVPNDVYGCAVVLAHELGHALGASDDPERGNNVWFNENPVRRDFGIWERKTYRGRSIVPSGE